MKNPSQPTDDSKAYLDFTGAVFHRPAMYTINGTLEEVAAFLEGYYSGAAKCPNSPYAWKEAETWGEFCRWLCAKLAISSTGWHGTFKAMRQRFPEDAAAFAQILIWHEEFLLR